MDYPYFFVSILFLVLNAPVYLAIEERALTPFLNTVEPLSRAPKIYPSDFIVVSGSFLNPGVASALVLNEVPLTVVFWNSTQIVAVLPPFAISGNLTSINTDYGDSNTYSLTINSRALSTFYGGAGLGWGGLHFMKYSGDTFSFRGYGEYVLSQIGNLIVQIRQEPCPASGFVCITAVAMQAGATVFSVYNGDFRTYINHNLQQIVDKYENSDISITNGTHTLQVMAGAVQLEISYSAEFGVELVNVGNGGNAGLLGNFSLAWVWKNGTSPKIDSQALVNDYAESWRVDAVSTLFEYDNGNSYPSQNPTSYVSVPVNFTGPQFSFAATACQPIWEGSLANLCGDVVPEIATYYAACVDDVAASNDVAHVENSIVALTSACRNFDAKDITNDPNVPVIAMFTKATGQGLLGAFVEQPTYFSITTYNALLSVASQNAQFNVSFEGFADFSPPSGNGNGTYVVTYTPTALGSGSLLIHVNLVTNGNQIPIFGSPFSVPISETTSAAMSDMYGPGLQNGPVSVTTWFMINAKTQAGLPVTVGRDLFTVVSSPTLAFSIADNLDGTYLVTYLPNDTGTYTISVALGGVPILGSPFTVQIFVLKGKTSCTTWGGTHISTYNGRVFEYHGYGEFVLTKIGNLIVQVRQAPCKHSSAICNTAVVGKENNTTLAIYHNGTAPSFYMNGQPTIPSTASVLPMSIIPGKATYQYVMAFASALVEVRVYPTRLDVAVRVDLLASYPNSALAGGLCGYWDMFYTRSDGINSFGLESVSFAPKFGETWRVSPAMSLFDYTGTTYAAVNNLNYTQQYNFSAPALEEYAAIMCSVVTTGDMAEKCNPLLAPNPFYYACLSDIYAGSDLGAREKKEKENMDK